MSIHLFLSWLNNSFVEAFSRSRAAAMESVAEVDEAIEEDILPSNGNGGSSRGRGGASGDSYVESFASFVASVPSVYASSAASPVVRRSR